MMHVLDVILVCIGFCFGFVARSIFVWWKQPLTMDDETRIVLEKAFRDILKSGKKRPRT